jgi:hypothetical protein
VKQPQRLCRIRLGTFGRIGRSHFVMARAMFSWPVHMVQSGSFRPGWLVSSPFTQSRLCASMIFQRRLLKLCTALTEMGSPKLAPVSFGDCNENVVRGVEDIKGVIWASWSQSQSLVTSKATVEDVS